MAISSPKFGLTLGKRGWFKSIDGRTRWVCSIRQAPTGQQADAVYAARFADLHADPVPVSDVLTIETVAGLFMDRKQSRLTAGKLDDRTLDEYQQAIGYFLASVGKSTAADKLIDDTAAFQKFRDECEKRFAYHRLHKWIVIVRSLFKWASKPPIRLRAPDYGESFDLPTRTDYRRNRRERERERGTLEFAADEIAALLLNARPIMRAMILLACNAGFGATDVAELRRGDIELNKGTIDYSRRKTGMDRRCVLWPETIDAIRRIGESVRNPKREHDDLLFVTRYGLPYVRGMKDQTCIQFTALCRKCKCYRRDRSFYSLRRTFRTLADECHDQRAAALVMGHEVGDVGGLYVQRISDARLKAIADHVRDSLNIKTSYAKVLESIAAKRRKLLSDAALRCRASRLRRRQRRTGESSNLSPS